MNTPRKLVLTIGLGLMATVAAFPPPFGYSSVFTYYYVVDWTRLWFIEAILAFLTVIAALWGGDVSG